MRVCTHEARVSRKHATGEVDFLRCARGFPSSYVRGGSRGSRGQRRRKRRGSGFDRMISSRKLMNLSAKFASDNPRFAMEFGMEFSLQFSYSRGECLRIHRRMRTCIHIIIHIFEFFRYFSCRATRRELQTEFRPKFCRESSPKAAFVYEIANKVLPRIADRIQSGFNGIYVEVLFMVKFTGRRAEL